MPDEKTPGRYPTPRSMEAPTHPTVQIPKVQVPTTQMDELLALGHATAKKVDTISDGVVDLNTRMDQMEERQDKFESRLNTNSSIKGLPSKTDLELQASLAVEAASRATFEKKIEDRFTSLETNLQQNSNDTASILRAIGTEAKGFFERNPKVGQAFVMFVLAALVTGTILVERLAK